MKVSSLVGVVQGASDCDWAFTSWGPKVSSRLKYTKDILYVLVWRLGRVNKSSLESEVMWFM
jgi:hypothetical protein